MPTLRRRWLPGSRTTAGRLAVAALLLAAAVGCAVPQPRGAGELKRVTEPTTSRAYWLYLPESYVQADETGRASRPWPLVFSFHGMKPFDTAHAQAREWQQEADRYGFIVVAPELIAPDVLRQFPVRRVAPSFKSDEEATLAILDHVCATTHADSKHVLATSWSSGGYLAHYMLNHHPDRFTCLAVRQSNYSEPILDAAAVPRSLHHPVLILSTQNDFAGVKRETQQAINWYQRYGYTNFAWIEIKALGHERTPDMAAAFFARVAGVSPNRPPLVLARRQAIGGNPRGLALLTDAAAPPPPVVARATPQQPETTRTRPPTGPRPTPHARAVTLSERNDLEQPRPRPSTLSQTPAETPQPLPRVPVSIRVSSAIGTEPFLLAFSADCPADWQRTADFLWTLDGNPICTGLNGHKTITDTGEHTLGLLVKTQENSEHRAYRLIRVLPHIGSAERPGCSGGS
ncbi:MAG: prolyl oligopeptidase family serine peptidase [Phycisphaerae bacterium]|jgi:poly(3-hydroxybutyrate) depolymerase